MNPITLKQLQDNWYQKENVELMQKRRRRYLHFDPVIYALSRPLTKKIWDPNWIKTHSFLPLIKYDQKNRLYKKDFETGKRKFVNKPRPLAYTSHIDALIHSWYSYQLSESYEGKVKGGIIDQSVIAYRKLEKSNIEFAKEVFDFIKDQKDCTAVAVDIKGFYDTLDFKILKKAWCNMLSITSLPDDHYAVFKSVTAYSFVTKKDFNEVQKKNKDLFEDTKALMDILRESKKIGTNMEKLVGIPQGTTISCILSNIYMYQLDLVMQNAVMSVGGLYRRYSDDIIFVCPSNKAPVLYDILKVEIEKLHLEIQELKTEICIFTEGAEGRRCQDKEGKTARLQYLGIEFDGEKLYLRHKGFAKYQRKMTKFIRKTVRKAQEKKMLPRKHLIYEKFTGFGKTTYIQYARRAAEKLGSNTIGKQIGHHRVFKAIKIRMGKELAKGSENQNIPKKE